MDKEKLIQKYLDGELSGEEEQQALHIIADDPELRSLLSFEQRTLKAFSQSSNDLPEVPEGFSKSVMQEIEQKSARAGTGMFYFIKEWIQSLLKPRLVRLRPVTAASVAVLLLVVVALPFYFTSSNQNRQSVTIPQQGSQQNDFRQVSRTQEEQVWVRFVYIDEKAESIAVAGDFNDWNPKPLTKQEVNGEQVWSGLVSMSRGEHNYMFLKNGEKWLTDPMAPVHRNDGFGNKNAVIYL